MSRTSASNKDGFPAKTPPPAIRGDFFFNTESKLLNDSLTEILSALGGSAGESKGVENLEQITLGTGVTENPSFAPSFFSIVNPSSNNGDIEVTISTRDGDKNLTISPGETLSPPSIAGLTYTVAQIVNSGDEEAQYFGILIGLA